MNLIMIQDICHFRGKGGQDVFEIEKDCEIDQDIKYLHMNTNEKDTLGECGADALRDSEAVT
jgi:hypothetical protein